jgi:TolA-binding protein
MKLRPVTFQYKADADGTKQYGLIAEEVEKVYLELVIEGNDGKPETVEYQVLPAMLLNEVQKEHRDSERKAAQIPKLSAQNTKLNTQISEMKISMRRQNVAFEERLSRIEQTVASRDGGRNIAAAFTSPLTPLPSGEGDRSVEKDCDVRD